MGTNFPLCFRGSISGLLAKIVLPSRLYVTLIVCSYRKALFPKMRSNLLIGRMAASMQIEVFSTKSWRSTVPSGCAWDPFAIIKKGPSHFGVAGSFKSLHVSGEITEISAPVSTMASMIRFWHSTWVRTTFRQSFGGIVKVMAVVSLPFPNAFSFLGAKYQLLARVFEGSWAKLQLFPSLALRVFWCSSCVLYAQVDYTNYKLDARPAFFCPEYLPYVNPADSDHVIPTLYAPVPVWVLSGPV